MVLLFAQSCRQKGQASAMAPGQKTLVKQLLDSMMPICRSMFDSVKLDPSRKQTLLRASQLIARIETMTEKEQHGLDSLAMAVRIESIAVLAVGDTARARKRIAYAKNIYRRTGDIPELARTYMTSFFCYSSGKEPAEKLAELDTAAQITLIGKDTLFYLEVMQAKTWVYNNMGQTDKCLEILTQLLKFQKERFPKNMPKMALALSSTYRQVGQYDKALQYGREAIDLLAADTITKSRAAYYQDIGYTYFDIGKRQEARKHFEKALELATTGHGESTTASEAISWITECYVSEHRYHEALAFLKKAFRLYPPGDSRGKMTMAENMMQISLLVGQYPQARQYADMLLRYDKQRIMEDDHKQYTYELIGKMHMQTKDFANARIYILKALDLSKKTNDLRSMMEDSKQMFIIDSTEGHYQSAIRWHQEYKKLSDIRKKNIQSKELSELDIKYETQKKTAALLSLAERSELQQTVIRQNRFVRNLITAIAVLLLVVLGILFSRYRLKQRVNKQLQNSQEKINQQNKSLENLIADERKLLAEKTGLLDEKEWLLKEIHHRVKNNLQIVMSLLNSQSSFIDNPAALTAIHDSQHRVHAMSLIHQKLYNANDLSSIEMSVYIRELVSYLADSFNTGQRIRFELNIQSVDLDVCQAVPLGLILNEAITNAIKYAFPDGRTGMINIALVNTSHNCYLLSIADNGIGTNLQLDHKRPGSLGMSLMAGLSEDLDGTFAIQNNEGTEIKITFVHDPRVKKPHTILPSFTSGN